MVIVDRFVKTNQLELISLFLVTKLIRKIS